jgi:hypothetical protein
MTVVLYTGNESGKIKTAGCSNTETQIVPVNPHGCLILLLSISRIPNAVQFGSGRGRSGVFTAVLMTKSPGIRRSVNCKSSTPIFKVSPVTEGWNAKIPKMEALISSETSITYSYHGVTFHHCGFYSVLDTNIYQRRACEDSLQAGKFRELVCCWMCVGVTAAGRQI